RDIVLVRVHADGVAGWGELVAGREPVYSEETAITATAMLRHHLLPLALGRTLDHPLEVGGWWRHVRGNPMAKAAVEMAVWDLWARATNRSLAEALGGTATSVPAGVSVGLQGGTEALLDRVAGYLDEGYARI